MDLDSQAEAKAVGPARPIANMVRGHELQSLATDDALALPGAAVRQRQGEAQIVLGGAEKAPAARLVPGAGVSARSAAGIATAADSGTRLATLRPTRFMAFSPFQSIMADWTIVLNWLRSAIRSGSLTCTM